MKYPEVKEVFIKYNTGIQSNAAVGRMFSAGEQIFTPRQNGLSDKLFEMSL